MPTLNSNPSSPFVGLLTVILQRLKARFTQRGFVWVTTAPESRISEYKAQDGLLVYVTSVRPKPKDGAGRYGRRVQRDVVVYVLTQSLHDVGGQDEIALLRHIAREEEVADVLDLNPPADLAYSLPTGILVEWVEGGDDIVRRVSKDPGVLVSALRFRVEYNVPMKVVRSA